MDGLGAKCANTVEVFILKWMPGDKRDEFIDDVMNLIAITSADCLRYVVGKRPDSVDRTEAVQ